MGVRYIHRATDGTWLYWTTYDDIKEFQPYQKNSSNTDPTQLNQDDSLDGSVEGEVDRDTTTEKCLIQPPEEPDILPTEDSLMPYEAPTATQQLRRMTMMEQASLPSMLREHTLQTADDDRDIQNSTPNPAQTLHTETAPVEKTMDKGYSSDASLSSHMDSTSDDDDQDPGFFTGSDAGTIQKVSISFFKCRTRKVQSISQKAQIVKLPKSCQNQHCLQHHPLRQIRYGRGITGIGTEVHIFRNTQ